MLLSLLCTALWAEDLPNEGAAVAGLTLVNPAVKTPHPLPFVDTERWTIPSDVVQNVRASSLNSLGERMEIATRSFLGALYINGAEGEGRGIDPDPPARYDVFDCLTFVETALGLSLSGDPLYAPLVRNQFRYQGQPDYTSRRHFMESQWIHDAVAAGLITDITAKLGPTHTIHKSVTAQTWAGWGRRHSLFGRLPDTALPLGSFDLPYMDLDTAAEAVLHAPAGAIVLTIHADRVGVPTVVSHTGIVIRLPGQEPMMRHASRMGKQVVRQDTLSWYVAHLREYSNWPIAGLSFLMPREQGPRISALPSGGHSLLSLQ